MDVLAAIVDRPSRKPILASSSAIPKKRTTQTNGDNSRPKGDRFVSQHPIDKHGKIPVNRKDPKASPNTIPRRNTPVKSNPSSQSNSQSNSRPSSQDKYGPNVQRQSDISGFDIPIPRASIRAAPRDVRSPVPNHRTPGPSSVPNRSPASSSVPNRSPAPSSVPNKTPGSSPIPRNHFNPNATIPPRRFTASRPSDGPKGLRPTPAPTRPTPAFTKTSPPTPKSRPPVGGPNRTPGGKPIRPVTIETLRGCIGKDIIRNSKPIPNQANLEKPVANAGAKAAPKAKLNKIGGVPQPTPTRSLGGVPQPSKRPGAPGGLGGLNFQPGGSRMHGRPLPKARAVHDPYGLDEYDDDDMDFIDDGAIEVAATGAWRSALRGITGYDPAAYAGKDEGEACESSWNQQEMEEIRSSRVARMEDAIEMKKIQEEEARERRLAERKALL